MLMTVNDLARLNFEMADLGSAIGMADKLFARGQQMLTGNGYDIQIGLSNKVAGPVAQDNFQEVESILYGVLKMRFNAFHYITTEALTNVLEQKGNTKVATNLHKRIAESSNGRQWLPEAGAFPLAGLFC